MMYLCKADAKPNCKNIKRKRKRSSQDDKLVLGISANSGTKLITTPHVPVMHCCACLIF